MWAKMAARRKSLAEELAELVDPAPLTFDPEHTDLNEAGQVHYPDQGEFRNRDVLGHLDNNLT